MFGALWVLAATSGVAGVARDRDAVLVDARQAAINLNTLDYRNVDGRARPVGAVVHRPGARRVPAEPRRVREARQESRRSTVATVPDAAVTELDEHAGVARVLVGVDVTVTPEGQAPVVTRQRLQLEMTRTPAAGRSAS